MAASPDRKTLERKRKALERKHGEPFRILRASNGEIAILPVEYIKSCMRTAIDACTDRVVRYYETK